VVPPETRLIVGVFTCPKHADRARAVRETWWADLSANTTRYFVECRPGEPARVEGDTLYLDCPEAYEALPRKTVAFLAYCLEHHGDAHVYKCDDDTHVDTGRLLALPWHDYDYFGEYYTQIDQAPRDWHFGKCTDKSKEVPYERPIRSPWMLGGPGYFLSPKATRLAVERTARLLPDALYEDVMIGEALDDPSIKTGGVPAFTGEMGTIHPCPPAEMRKRHAAPTQTPQPGAPFRVRHTDVRLDGKDVHLAFKGPGGEQSRIVLTTEAAGQISETLAEAVRLAGGKAPAARPNAQGVLGIRFAAGVGPIAQLRGCLQILAHCERHGLKPWIELLDAQGDDWLGDAYGHRQPTDKPAQVHAIGTLSELKLPEDYCTGLDLRGAEALFAKYFWLKAAWQERIDSVWERLGLGEARSLGVYHGGSANAALAEYAKRRMADGGFDRILVVGDAALVPGIAGHYSDADHATHAIGGAEIPADILEACLLMARCVGLVSDAPGVAGWANLLKPELDAELVGAPAGDHTPFPDRTLTRVTD